LHYVLLYFSDGLRHDASLTDSSGHITADNDIIENIRQLLTDLINDVVVETGNDSDCARKPSKRSATDILESSEPKRRRPLGNNVTQTSFDPVAEHYQWCPYVSDIVSNRMADDSHDVLSKPWLRFLRQLVPDHQAALTQVQTSPVPEGIERIRKVFRSWTSTA